MTEEQMFAMTTIINSLSDKDALEENRLNVITVLKGLGNTDENISDLFPELDEEEEEDED